MAGATAVVAAHRNAGGIGGYSAAAAGLTLGAIFTARGYRLITLIGLVACAGQPLAVVATAWELTHRVSHTQVEKLQTLGINPKVGVAVNLVFSLCASAVAVWALRTRRRPRGTSLLREGRPPGEKP